MTRILVSVTNAAEAAAALSAGAQLIDAKDPAKGALGALPPTTVKAIVDAVGGKVETSAAAGDHPSLNQLIDLASAGADYVKVAIPGGDEGAAMLSLIGRSLAGRTKLVALFAADKEPALDLVPVAAMAGFSGVMLDTVDKSAGLLSVMEMADIAHFVAAARRAKVMVGLAGSLKIVDVGTLLPLKPDLLGFRGGVCIDGDRSQALDPSKIRALMAAMAVHGIRSTAAE
ncbi:(5-formylfuran-3-yl)methyl phosphate synthase [Oryzibacter oryziterrae]|uniref:(5-formylfuran-3-yl)methyl phosphate synthase n=1 Tax=Oryzibacter oryziterrae TaxID=2766474 RepID=UPI001F17655F|nr:(5-formylfuran-3-yl)methyl phosphate synthase [Oryzibacter oryziterrae]